MKRKRRLAALLLVTLSSVSATGDQGWLPNAADGITSPETPRPAQAGPASMPRSSGTVVAAGDTGGAAPLEPAASSPAPQEKDEQASTDSSGNQADDDEPVMRTGVPEGFDAYTQPQKTLVEVYFNDQHRLSAMAEYTPDTIRFLNPEKVIRSLPGLKERGKLLADLRGELPGNGNRVCVRAGQSDCGTLSPETIGVVFDERRFRVDVFVHPRFIARADSGGDGYLDEPDQAGTGLVQNLSFNHAGSTPGEDRFSLFGRTRAGHGTRHLFSSWVSTEEQDLSVDELGFREDFRNHQFSAGLYEPHTEQLTLLRRDPIAGVGLRRSFNRHRDVETAFSTEVEVLLTARSRVELIKDGRLYDVRFYEPGKRSLDTERLPPGAYELTIRISESGGRERILTRFFVKSRRLAPKGEYLWFAHLGRAHRRATDELFPEDAGTMITTGGLRYRYQDQLGLGVAGAATENAGLLEGSADWLSPAFQAHGSVFASTEGSAGWLVRGSASHRDMRVIFDSQRVRAEEPDPEDEYVLLPDTLERDSVELRVPATGGQYFASWRRIERNDQDEQRVATLGYTHTLRLAGRQTLNLNTSFSRSNGDRVALLSLDWRFSGPRWQHQAGLSWRDSEAPGDTEGLSGRASSTWEDGNTLVDDVQVTAGVEGDENARRLSLEGQHESQYGRGRAGVTWSDRDELEDRRLSSATYDTNVVASTEAAAVGGPELNEAGVIIDLRGADGALFDVLVDGKQRFVARGGGRAALTLPPYERYRIAIRDRGTEFVHYDNSTRQITLYPGNVKTLSWDLQRVFIVLGKLVRPDGTPLGDRVVQGTRGITTADPDGYFQGEVLGTDAKLFAQIDGRRCRLETGPIRPENGVARLGRVVCRPLNADDIGPAQPTTGPTPP